MVKFVKNNKDDKKMAELLLSSSNSWF